MLIVGTVPPLLPKPTSIKSRKANGTNSNAAEAKHNTTKAIPTRKRYGFKKGHKSCNETTCFGSGLSF